MREQKDYVYKMTFVEKRNCHYYYWSVNTIGVNKKVARSYVEREWYKKHRSHMFQIELTRIPKEEWETTYLWKFVQTGMV